MQHSLCAREEAWILSLELFVFRAIFSSFLTDARSLLYTLLFALSVFFLVIVHLLCFWLCSFFPP